MRLHREDNGTRRLRRRILVWCLILGVVGAVTYGAYRYWVCGPGYFAYAIGRQPDESLPRGRVGRSGVDIVTTTPNDFPEFLGMGRLAAVNHVRLDPDWTKRPPRLLWRQDIGAGWSAFSIVNGFAATMEQRGPLEQVSCYRLKDGSHYWSVGWRERFPIMGVGPRSTPTIFNGCVYAIGAWGHLTSIDGNSGEVIWERELLADLGIHWQDEYREITFGRSGSPLVTQELVIVPGGGLRGNRASLLAYNRQTGALVWRGGRQQISYASPMLATLAGVRQVVTVNEKTVAGHAVVDGQELWSFSWPGNSSSDASASQPIPLSADTLLITKGYRRGAAVIRIVAQQKETRMHVEKVWSRRSVLRTKFSTPCVWDGHAYGLSDGILQCVDLQDGTSCWKEGRYAGGQILRVHDKLLVLSEGGELVLVRLDPAKPNAVAGRVQALTGTTYNNIALYGAYVLVRNATQAACYQLPLLPKQNEWMK